MLTKKSVMVGTVVCLCSFLLIYMINEQRKVMVITNEINDNDDDSNVIVNLQKPRLRGKRHCKPIETFFFLKIHKTGSTTIQNIIFRYGYTRNKTFIVAKNKFILNFVRTEKWEYLERPANNSLDIIATHAVYDKTKVSGLLHKNVVRFTILRHPMNRLISGIYFWGIAQQIPFPKITTFLKHFNKYDRLARINIKSLPKKWQRSILINAMAYELGVEPGIFNHPTLVIDYARTIHKDFKLVMVLERMDESLVLLKRIMCWKLKDILMKVSNANPVKEHEKPTNHDRRRHRKIAQADYTLYHYFHMKLNEQIRNEGLDFQGEVTWYREVNQRVHRFCVMGFASSPAREANKFLQIEASSWNRPFNVRATDCDYMRNKESHFIHLIELKQYGSVHKPIVWKSNFRDEQWII